MKHCGRGVAVVTGSWARRLVVILGLGLLGFGPLAGIAVRAQGTGDGPTATTEGPGRIGVGSTRRRR